MYREEKWLDRFTKHMGYMAWVHVLYGYDDKHLFVSDEDILQRVKGARKAPLRCRLAPPEDYQSSITDNIKKILVFCRSGELGIVKELTRKYPKRVVTSGTYGFSLVGADHYPFLIPFGSRKPLPTIKERMVVLSTSYADAEFLGQLLHKNGGPNFQEFLGRQHGTWMQQHRPFQISRFMDQVSRRFAASGTLAVHLQADVLMSLFDNTSLTLDRMVDYWRRTGTRVVVVKRRDRMFQAILGQILSRTAERSVWTKKPSRLLEVQYNNGDFIGYLRRSSLLLDEEALLNDILSSAVETLDIHMEDVISAPQEGLETLASFLGIKLNDTFEAIDYFSGFEAAPHLLAAHDQVRRDWIDRVGLHVPPVDFGRAAGA